MIIRDFERQKWLIIVSLVAVIVGLVFLLKGRHTKSQAPENIRGYVEERIEELGPEAAYRKIKRVYESKDYSSQHLAAHYFGESLFDAIGKKGVLICDNAFGFGCYHGLFIKAISEGGIEAAKELDEVCVERYGVSGLGCPHGIGHGLGEYLGSNNLLSQLEVCDELTWQGRLFGCKGGVFMEYNFPTVIGESTASFSVRGSGDNDYHEPCRSLPERYRNACYFEQASWWREVLNEDYEKMGLLCQEINDSLQKEDCFRGIGNTAAETNHYDINEALEACKKMPSQDEKILCRAGASWAFFANPEKRSLSRSLCDGLGLEGRDLCLSKSDLLNERKN